jgi:thiamine biosynthesis protein ThiS
MKIEVNSIKKEVLQGTTIHGLLTQLNIVPQRVAVELNLSVIDKNQFEQVSLKEGDCVEIINFVGGGEAPASSGNTALVGAVQRKGKYGSKQTIYH